MRCYIGDVSLPPLRCVSLEEAQYILAKIYEEVCGNHSCGRDLAGKVIRADDYWPCALKDDEEFAKKCIKCQLFVPAPHCPPKKLKSVMSPWPFAQWGVNTVGPLFPSKEGVRFVVVAVDYFTKWVEAETLATITTKNITKFLWKTFIFRFGISWGIILDNLQ